MEVSQGWGGEGLSQDMMDRCMKCEGQSGVGWGEVKPGYGVGWGGAKPGYGGQIYIHVKSVEVSQGWGGEGLSQHMVDRSIYM